MRRAAELTRQASTVQEELLRPPHVLEVRKVSLQAPRCRFQPVTGVRREHSHPDGGAPQERTLNTDSTNKPAPRLERGAGVEYIRARASYSALHVDYRSIGCRALDTRGLAGRSERGSLVGGGVTSPSAAASGVRPAAAALA